MRKKSIITERTNEEIIEEIRARQSEGMGVNYLYMELYDQNKGIINLFIYKVLGATKISDIEDMMQEAFIALLKAVENYDESRGAFTSCLFYYIRASVLNYLRETRPVILPYGVNEHLIKLSKIETAYEKVNGRKPPKKYILKTMEISETVYKRLLTAREIINQQYLQDQITEDIEIGDTIADTRDNLYEIEERLDREKLSRDIAIELDNLPPNYKAVIVDFYFNGMSYNEIADKMDEDTAYIRSALANAKRLLAKSERIKELYEQAFCISVKYSLSRFMRTNTSSTEATALRLYEIDQQKEELRKERYRAQEPTTNDLNDYDAFMNDLRAKIAENKHSLREILQSASG